MLDDLAGEKSVCWDTEILQDDEQEFNVSKQAVMLLLGNTKRIIGGGSFSDKGN